MTHTLPSRPDLTILKKQAKKLLKGFRDNSNHTQHQQALSDIQQYHPQPSAFQGLRDAQLVVARSYGLQDWAALKNAVELERLSHKSLAEQVEQFIRFACLQHDGSNEPAVYKYANSILKNNPSIASYDLYTAIVANDVSHVKRLLDEQPDLATKSGGPLSWPPILYAAYSRIEEEPGEEKAIEILELLLEKGADPNSFYLWGDQYRFAALTGVMGEGEGGSKRNPPHQYAEKMARILLDSGANPNDAQGLYNTIFEENSLYWIKLLMEYGLNKEHKIDWDQTDDAQTCFDFLLAYAVKNGYFDRVIFLLDVGASPNAVNGYDHHSIYVSSRIMGYSDITEYLVKCGAKVEILNKDDEFRCLISEKDSKGIDEFLQSSPEYLEQPDFLLHAAAHSSFPIVQQLISLGYDIDGISSDGRTILHVYAWDDDVEKVKTLVEQGARFDIKDSNYQSTALGHANFNNSTQVRNYLLDLTDDILEVVWGARYDRIKALLEEDPTLIKTRTPLGNSLVHVIGFPVQDDLDEENGEKILDLLLRGGLSLNEAGDKGKTPLDFAEETGQEVMIDILTRRGARRNLT